MNHAEEYPFHARHPAVIPLGMHLVNGQRIYFAQDNVHSRIFAYALGRIDVVPLIYMGSYLVFWGSSRICASLRVYGAVSDRQIATTHYNLDCHCWI